METPLVSICSITYNHAPFIRQCLDGFLMQQCNFPIEIIINDDCSTDGTTEIIREYAEKYPDKIFPILHEKNLYSQGVRGMFQKFVFPKARGKYIALCEGDDYWTDPLKLQKQVDFLESHPDYSMCFHGVAVACDEEMELVKDFVSLEEREYSRREIIEKWTVPTASAVFRSEVIKYIPSRNKFTVGDIVVFVTCSYHGKMFCLRDCMSVYRRHKGSWSDKNMMDMSLSLIQHWKEMKRAFPSDICPWINGILAYRYVYCFREYCRRRQFFKAAACLLTGIGECHVDLLVTFRNMSANKFVRKLLGCFIRHN